MLTSLILLATTMCPVQDGQRPAPATDAPAAADPAVAPDAPPAETSEKVRTFLTDAESHLYDPKVAGLKTLTFDLPIDHPTLGNLGTAHVSWTADAPPDIKVERNADATLPPGVQPDQIDSSGMGASQQIIETLVNHPISSMLNSSVATMSGAEEGLVKVSLTNPEMTSQGVTEQALYFDDESHLQKFHLAAEQMGQTIQQNYTFSWKPAEASEQLVLDTQTMEMDTPMGKVSSSSAYGYRTVEGLTLVTRMTVNTDAPPMFGGKSTQTLVARNLVVNGKAVPDEAPAPGPAPTEPAAGG